VQAQKPADRRAGISRIVRAEARPHQGRIRSQEVDKGNLPAWCHGSTAQGQAGLLGNGGIPEQGSRQPLSKDAIFRIYSMTKPLVSVAAIDAHPKTEKMLAQRCRVEIHSRRERPAGQRGKSGCRVAKVTYTLYRRTVK